jgi:hypothetical protein
MRCVTAVFGRRPIVAGCVCGSRRCAQLHEVLKDDKRIHPGAVGDTGAAGGGPQSEEDADPAARRPKVKEPVRRGAAGIVAAVAEGLRPLAPATDPAVVAFMQTLAVQGQALNQMMGMGMMMMMRASAGEGGLPPEMMALATSMMSAAAVPGSVATAGGQGSQAQRAAPPQPPGAAQPPPARVPAAGIGSGSSSSSSSSSDSEGEGDSD